MAESLESISKKYFYVAREKTSKMMFNPFIIHSLVSPIDYKTIENWLVFMVLSLSVHPIAVDN
jgi:hypothetical protein